MGLAGGKPKVVGLSSWESEPPLSEVGGGGGKSSSGARLEALFGCVTLERPSDPHVDRLMSSWPWGS